MRNSQIPAQSPRQFYAMAVMAFVLIVLSLSRCHAQQFSNTVAATYNFQYLNAGSPNVRSLTFTPVQPWQSFPWPGSTLSHNSNGVPQFGQMLLPTPQTYSILLYPTMTNGSLTVSNLWTGVPYLVTITDLYTNATITNFFQTNDFPTETVVDASTNLAYVVNAIVFPAGVNGTNGVTVAAGANVTMVTNGSVVTISSSGGGGGGSGTATNLASNLTATNLTVAGVPGLAGDISGATNLPSSSLTGTLPISLMGNSPSPFGRETKLRNRLAGVTNVAVIGTSISYGANLPATNINWPYLWASNNNIALGNLAVSGSYLSDFWAAAFTLATTNQGLIALEQGINNLGGDGSLVYTNAFFQEYTGYLLLMEMGTNRIKGTDASMVTTGSWNTASNGGVSPGIYSTGLWTTGNGNTISNQVYGASVGILMMGFQNNESQFTVNIDGVARGTFDALYDNRNVNTYNGFIFTNLGMGFHGVTVACAAGQGSNICQVEFIAGIDTSAASKAPVILCPNIIPASNGVYNTTQQKNLSVYNNVIFRATQLSSYANLPVIEADFSGAMAGIGDTNFNSTLHPNSWGAVAMAGAAYNVVGFSDKDFPPFLKSPIGGGGYAIDLEKKDAINPSTAFLSLIWDFNNGSTFLNSPTALFLGTGGTEYWYLDSTTHALQGTYGGNWPLNAGAATFTGNLTVTGTAGFNGGTNSGLLTNKVSSSGWDGASGIFTGSASGLISIPAAQLTGTVPYAALPGSLGPLSTNNAASLTNYSPTNIAAGNASTGQQLTFTNGYWTNLNASGGTPVAGTNIVVSGTTVSVSGDVWTNNDVNYRTNIGGILQTNSHLGQTNAGTGTDISGGTVTTTGGFTAGAGGSNPGSFASAFNIRLQPNNGDGTGVVTNAGSLYITNGNATGALNVNGHGVGAIPTVAVTTNATGAFLWTGGTMTVQANSTDQFGRIDITNGASAGGGAQNLLAFTITWTHAMANTNFVTSLGELFYYGSSTAARISNYNLCQSNSADGTKSTFFQTSIAGAIGGAAWIPFSYSNPLQ